MNSKLGRQSPVPQIIPPNIPVVPAIYEHAARLINVSPWACSRSGEFLYAAHRAAWERYRHRHVVVGVDLYNVEPEAYGAKVREPHGNGTPVLEAHLCESLGDLLKLPELEVSAGRIPLILSAASRLKRDCPEADVRVPLCGPLALASGLVGFETLLMDALEEPDLACSALRRLVDGQLRYVEAAAREGLGVMVFESSAAPPLMSPELFREIELPALVHLFEGIRGAIGETGALILGGDTALIARDLCGVPAGYMICPAETNQAAFLQAFEARPEVTLRANLPASLLAAGDLAAYTEIVAERRRILSARAAVELGTGVVPYDCEPAFLQAVLGL